METLYRLIDLLLPFSFLEMTFMKNALIGVVLAAPILGLLSTMVVNQKMAFFSDAIGHSALTGIGIGIVLGIANPTWAMLLFAIVLSVAITYFGNKNEQMRDTVIAVFSAGSVALGTMLLSRGGNFSQYTSYLIGDLLSITSQDLLILLILGIIVYVMWYFIFNKLVLVSLNNSLANSRKVNTFKIQILFTIVVAVVVVLCIPWIGVMLINAFLILPAACSRNIAQNLRQYQLYCVLIALGSGILGLVVAYYIGASVGATIVVIMTLFYILTYVMRK